MSKVFGTLAAVFLAASAFVAWKNQTAYKKEIEALHTEQREEKSTTKELAKQQQRLVDADEANKNYIAQHAEVQSKLEGVNAEFSEAKKVVEALEKESKSKEKEIASSNEALQDLPDPKELVPRIKRMRAQLADATNAIATDEARLANLTRLDQDGKARIEATRKIMSDITSGKSLSTMKTSIGSIYRNWGFVILNAGDKQGVVSGSTLDVVRGEEVIGKLKVTAVEAGRSSANIIMDSVPAGVTLRSGDSVVPEQESATPAASGQASVAPIITR